jgi:hypothetical protein
VPVRHSFDYAIIRVTPRLERGESINAGIVLFCRTQRFLAAPTHCDVPRLQMLDPTCDSASIAEHLAVFSGVARGDKAYGPIAQLPIAERFHWLVAPRSTIIATTPVHCGVCDDPDATVHALLRKLVYTS